ncbi:MAG: TetR/AcrR family transcriptional regulator [Oscillospiraceae bacterium]|nr:TetR/AcrR family transcriptional regulator [Oscillospiraceae bacterium]
MPPKPKFTKEEIVNGALELVSEKGIEYLTTRNLGEWLGSSARPIFTVFNSMDEVIALVHEAALERFNSYIREIVDFTPAFKEAGIRMVRFAIREPKLFQLIFMTESKKPAGPGSFFGSLGEYEEICTAVIVRDYGLNAEEAKVLFQHMWTYTYGISALCATKMCMFSEMEIANLIGTEFLAITSLIKGGNMYATTPLPVPGHEKENLKTNDILENLRK